MRKYAWIIVLTLTIGTVIFTSCGRVDQIMEPVTPDAEQEDPDAEQEDPSEMVETPAETTPGEGTADPVEMEEVEKPETTEPEMPEEPMDVDPTTTPAIDGPIVSVSPAQITSPAVGEQLQVAIEIAQAADVNGFDLKLEFDPNALKYVSGSLGDYLPAGQEQEVLLKSVNFIGWSGAPVTASSGTLVTITFEVLAAQASTLTLSEVTLVVGPVGEALEITPTTADGEISAP